MALHCFLFVSSAITFLVLVSVSPSSSLTVDSLVLQECSLVGIELQNCLVPSAEKTQFSIDSCCATLNQVLEAGYYCLCILMGPPGYPVFSAELSLSFSSCYISVPPLTHCHEPRPVALAPPVTALPLLTNEPLPPPPPLTSTPLPPLLKPPDFPRGDGFVPLPPKVLEIPLNENSSVVDGYPIVNSTPLPMLGIPERLDDAKSDGGSVEMMVNLRCMLMMVGFWLSCMRNWNEF